MEHLNETLLIVKLETLFLYKNKQLKTFTFSRDSIVNYCNISHWHHTVLKLNLTLKTPMFIRRNSIRHKYFK